MLKVHPVLWFNAATNFLTSHSVLRLTLNSSLSVLLYNPGLGVTNHAKDHYPSGSFWLLIMKRQHWIKLTNLFENIFFWFQTYISNQAQYVAFILYGSEELNSRDSLNVQALGPIFMFRLKLRLNAHVPCAGKKCSASVLGSIFRINVQAQYLIFFCLKKFLRLNVQAQCLGSMCLIYLVYFR